MLKRKVSNNYKTQEAKHTEKSNFSQKEKSKARWYTLTVDRCNAQKVTTYFSKELDKQNAKIEAGCKNLTDELHEDFNHMFSTALGKEKCIQDMEVKIELVHNINEFKKTPKNKNK